MALGWRKEYLRYSSYFLNIQNVYKTRKDLRMFLEILLSLATVSIFGIFALNPTVLTIAELYKEIKTKEKTITQMDTKIKNLQTAQTILDTEGELFSLLETSIPSSPKPNDLVYQINGLVNKNFVSVINFSVDEIIIKGETPAQKASSKNPQTLEGGALGMGFTFSTSGNYQSLFSVLTDLENMRMPVKITNFGISKSKSDTDTALNLTVTGKVPYLEIK